MVPPNSRSGKTAKTLNDFIKDVLKEIFLREPTKEDMDQIIQRNIGSSGNIEFYTKSNPYKLAVIKRKGNVITYTIARYLLRNEDKTYSVVSTIEDRASIKKVK